MNATNINDVERALEAMETLLGVKLTIIDRDGVFRTPKVKPLFSKNRLSHQKNRVCALGFRPRCVAHCRHEANERGEECRKPFFTHCWKGVREVAIPLLDSDDHYGSLFAGSWRDPAGFPAEALKTLPNDFAKTYHKMPVFDKKQAETIAAALWTFSKGLLAMLREFADLQSNFTGRKREIWRFLRLKSSKKLVLDDLAAQLNLSPSRASHVVKELFGRSFSQLLLEERINRAKILLASDEQTVNEIAQTVGFEDPYHFNRAFKKIVGAPPGKYRRSVIGDPGSVIGDR